MNECGPEAAEIVDEYAAEGIFWVTEAARWRKLTTNSRNPKFGIMFDNAIREIERENESLNGARHGSWVARRSFLPVATGLIELFSSIEFGSILKESTTRSIVLKLKLNSCKKALGCMTC